jgi:putative oxidoreductase
MAISRTVPQSGYLLSLLRIVAGFTFTLHGLQKFGAFGGMGGHGGKVTAFTLVWFAAVLEALGGPLLILGLCTRPVAFILCGEMAFAYFHAHAPRGLWPVANGGELAILYCFIFLYLFAAGPGPVSVDRLMGKRGGRSGR